MITLWLAISLLAVHPEWGFFGHTLINRVAVFTLPNEMIDWYKPNIDYLAEHAVDPDKRRYANRFEAPRHFIDLDHWGTFPFDHLPRYWDKALALNIQAYALKGRDTVFYISAIPPSLWGDTIVDLKNRLNFVHEVYLPKYYDDEPTLPGDSLKIYFPDCPSLPGEKIYLTDKLTPHGIVPYHLQIMLSRLTNAFKAGDYPKIMRLSAEMGHYVADACVPLHTTENYNGQLTDQVGIHAFWESRIPELFAINDFDMVVGTATYIDHPVDYFWNLVFTSHKEVNRVLGIEKELSQSYPGDQQYCYEDRNNVNIRTQCADFAKAYHLAMDKMVEDRFRVAVKAVGDVWYTAWIDAGQPDTPANKILSRHTKEDETLDAAQRAGHKFGREHE
jgi:hypothetical protein